MWCTSWRKVHRVEYTGKYLRMERILYVYARRADDLIFVWNLMDKR